MLGLKKSFQSSAARRLARLAGAVLILMTFEYTPRAQAIGGLNMGAYFQNPGQPIFTQQLGQGPNNPNSQALAQAVTTDASGNIFVSGYSSANLTSCGGVSANCAGGGSAGGSDYFLTKYNSSGAWQWTKTLGELGISSSHANSLTLDSTGNIYLAGYTSANLSACNGVSGACGRGTSMGGSDYFISKYDSSGNWQWTKTLGETGMATSANGIARDSSDNIYVTGYTSGDLKSCLGYRVLAAAVTRREQMMSSSPNMIPLAIGNGQKLWARLVRPLQAKVSPSTLGTTSMSRAIPEAILRRAMAFLEHAVEEIQKGLKTTLF